MSNRPQCRKRSTGSWAFARMYAAILSALPLTVIDGGCTEHAANAADRDTLGGEATPVVRVNAASSLTARAELREEGDGSRDEACRRLLMVRGTLHDDLGNPIPMAVLRTRFATRAEALAPLAPLDERAVGRRHTSRTYVCRDDGPEVAIDDVRFGLRAQTDDAGNFCLRTCVRVDELAVAIAFDGGPYQAGASTTLHVDRVHGALSLAFDPDLPPADLDGPPMPVTVRATGLLDHEWKRAKAAIMDEHHRELATVPFDDRGVAHALLPTDQLGGVGPSRLEARLVGDGLPALPNAVAAFDRMAHVRLDIVRTKTEWFGGALDVTVVARWRGGVVDGGAIEAQRQGALLSAAQVAADGTARLLLDSIATGDSPDTAVTLRYVPHAPFFLPGPSPALDLASRGSLRWPSALLVLATLGVALFALRNRPWPATVRAAVRAVVPRARAAASASRLAPVIQPGSGGCAARTGRVVDAHDGHPVAHAHVEVIAPSFPASRATSPTATRPDHAHTVLAAATSDADGSFALQVPASIHAVQLRARATWHSSVQWPLPPNGDLLVAMHTRRRALLERLVSWARRRDPRRQVAEPTPQEVMRAHRPSSFSAAALPSQDAERVETWAVAVQDAVFGPGVVDETIEAQVVALEPKSSGPVRT